MKIRVLLVDDEKDYVRSLSRQLSVRQCEVTAAYNGNEAIEKIQQERFDVIILDVLMPGKGGIEAFKEIKALDPTIPVIIHTGHARVDLNIEDLKDGIYDYLLKPVAINELMVKIQYAYQQKNAGSTDPNSIE